MTKTQDAETGVSNRRLNAMQKKRAKYEERFAEIGCKDAEWKGDKVINLARSSTTDLWCCFVLIGFLLVCLGLGFYGVSLNNGVPAIAPFDVDGKMCGISPGYESHRFLFFNVMTDDATKGGIFDSGVCARSCVVKAGEKADCIPNSLNKECGAPAFDTGVSALGLLCSYDPLQGANLEEKKVAAKRYADFNNKITLEFELSKSEARAAAYMIKALPALGICLVTAGAFSILWIYAMANCATGIAYVVIGLCELMMIAGILAGVAAP